MDSNIEYFIDNRDCLACVNRDIKAHEDPCYQCIANDLHVDFEPDDINIIADRISEL